MLQYIANFQPTLREKGQLLLIDRTIDPLVPLLHPINYQVRILLQFNSSQWLKEAAKRFLESTQESKVDERE